MHILMMWKVEILNLKWKLILFYFDMNKGLLYDEKVVKILKTYRVDQIVNSTTYEAQSNFNFGGN